MSLTKKTQIIILSVIVAGTFTSFYLTGRNLLTFVFPINNITNTLHQNHSKPPSLNSQEVQFIAKKLSRSDRRTSFLKHEIIIQAEINGVAQTGKLKWDGLTAATGVGVEGFPDSYKYNIEIIDGNKYKISPVNENIDSKIKYWRYKRN